jgi:hypothetical protein
MNINKIVRSDPNKFLNGYYILNRKDYTQDMITNIDGRCPFHKSSGLLASLMVWLLMVWV